MAKKEEKKTIVNISEENNTKIVLIKHYMAEKGMNVSEFDKAFEEAVNTAVEGMYKKYVPSTVRTLFDNSDITIGNISKKQTAEAKAVKNEENEEVI